MAEAKFDPYHAWLGIPAWDRPVNAYRLLGIEVFEENRKVIEAAANRQMAYLQELSSGDEHIEEAQKLLGLVSRARVLLLNPEKKAAYDKKLIAQLDSLSEATSDSSQTTKIPTHSSAAVTLAKKEKSLNTATRNRVILLLLLGALAVISVLLFWHEKPLEVRFYNDKNENKILDEDDELVKDATVMQTRRGSKGPEKLSDVYELKNIEGGCIVLLSKDITEKFLGFSIDQPWQINSKQGLAYYPVQLKTGPRFFAQVVDIPVIQIENAAQSSAEEKQSSPTAQSEVGTKNPQDTEPEKSSDSQASSFLLRGQITTANPESAPEVLESYWFIDTDGNGVFLVGKERGIEPDGQGRFEIMVQVDEIKDQTMLRIIESRFDAQFKNPGGISLSLEDIKEGVLVIAAKLERKAISYEGMVQIKPKGESAKGFIVYIDKNQNEQRDEDERQTKTNAEGNFQIEEEWFEDYQKPTILRVEADPDLYEMPLPIGQGRRNIKLPAITIKGANFKITKKELPGEQNNTVATEEKNAEPKPNPPPIIPTPESDSAGFLRNLGFEGEEPQEGSDTKPEWTFQTDPSALIAFTNAKRDYDKAAKKQNWNKISELNLQIQKHDRKIEELLTEAKTDAQTKRAQQLVATYNAAREKLNAELNQLKQSRNALLTPLVMAAEAIGEEQEMYNESVVKQDLVKKAEENLGVSVQPLTKKQNAAWQPALKFLAEDKLRSLGLQKQGRKWTPTGVAQAADLFVTLKQYLNNNFSEYVSLKLERNKLITQNAVANQSKIEKLQQQMTNQTGWKTYRDAKKEFDSGEKKYIDLLNKLQLQREELENNKEAIEKALTLLGGKYKVVINQYPSTEQIEQKKTLIAKWQSLIE